MTKRITMFSLGIVFAMLCLFYCIIFSLLTVEHLGWSTFITAPLSIVAGTVALIALVGSIWKFNNN